MPDLPARHQYTFSIRYRSVNISARLLRNNNFAVYKSIKSGASVMERLSRLALLIMLMSVPWQVHAQQIDDREHMIGTYLLTINIDADTTVSTSEGGQP